MGWRFEKTRDEWDAFVAEVVRDNWHRYKSVKEWPHLWVDLWVSLFSMSYTLGHIAAIIIPIILLWVIL